MIGLPFIAKFRRDEVQNRSPFNLRVGVRLDHLTTGRIHLHQPTVGSDDFDALGRCFHDGSKKLSFAIQADFGFLTLGDVLNTGDAADSLALFKKRLNDDLEEDTNAVR